jgi:branched-subunit amino acid aminotransferase/4-amino-4-deoxychorismate lyase
MSGKHAIFNGKLIDAEQAVLPVQDKEFQYGFGVYESLRVIQGRVVYGEDHIMRLFYSAEGLGLRHPYTSEQVTSYLMLLIEVDAIEDATIRILLMGGMEARLFITVAPLLTYPKSFYNEGIKAIAYNGERYLPQYKTCSLLMNYMALRQASSQGAFEALLVDRNGLILEGTRSNVFAFEEKSVYTAPVSMVLEGVTRDKIIKAAKKLGYRVVFEAPRIEDVLAGRFNELCISSTSMGAMPLSMLDDYTFNSNFSIITAIHTLIRQWELDALH